MVGIKGIEETTNLITLYPNPTNDQVTVSCSMIPLSIQLISITGEIITVIKPVSINTQVDLSSVASGIYFVRVQSQSGSVRYLKIVRK